MRGTVPGAVRLARDLHEEARAALPGPVYDHYAGGAGEERTLAGNTGAWDRLWLRPRHLTGVAAAATSADLLGTPASLPVAVAPMGAMDRLHPGGAAEMARGAAAAGAVFVLATRAGARPAEVAVRGAPQWLQLYVDRDRAVTAALLEEARDRGFGRVLLTVDLPVPGRRERSLAHGPAAPPVGGWAPLTWDDVAWVAEASRLPVAVKGVLGAQDARLAREAGADAIVVSNHGGRQLDGVVPSAVALREVADAGTGLPLLVDGGVRDGADVVRALALGAQGVLVGRPLAWALAARGSDGVLALLRALREDLARTLVLLGAATPSEVRAEHVRPAAW